MSAEAEPMTRRYTRLSPATWAEIRALWETGEPTLAELSDRYGVATRTLQVHFEKHGTVKGSKAREIAAAVKEEVFGEQLADKDLTTQRAKETREAAYRNAVTVENLVMAQLQEAQKDPASAFKAAAAIKSLSLAAAALERLHGLKRTALGLDHDSVLPDELPEIILREYTQEEIEQIRAEQAEDGETLDLVESDERGEEPDDIVIEGHDEEFDDIVIKGDDEPETRLPPPAVETDAEGFPIARCTLRKIAR